MPLIKGKSPKAFEHNVKAEAHAGKPIKQAVAIAYNIKRKAQKLANGGMVDDMEDMTNAYHSSAHHIAQAIMQKRMARGGTVDEMDEMEPSEEMEEEYLSGDLEPAEAAWDDREKRRQRIKAIMSR